MKSTAGRMIPKAYPQQSVRSNPIAVPQRGESSRNYITRMNEPTIVEEGLFEPFPIAGCEGMLQTAINDDYFLVTSRSNLHGESTYDFGVHRMKDTFRPQSRVGATQPLGKPTAWQHEPKAEIANRADGKTNKIRSYQKNSYNSTRRASDANGQQTTSLVDILHNVLTGKPKEELTTAVQTTTRTTAPREKNNSSEYEHFFLTPKGSRKVSHSHKTPPQSQTNTMTSSRGRQSFQIAMASEITSSSRTRSRAIPVKRNPNLAKEYEEIRETSNAEDMYDMATWRMYNRIIDYRQKHPVHPDYYNSASIQSSSSLRPLKSNCTEFSHDQTGSPVSVRIQESLPFDGEVFDLEI